MRYVTPDQNSGAVESKQAMPTTAGNSTVSRGGSACCEKEHVSGSSTSPGSVNTVEANAQRVIFRTLIQKA